MKKLRNIFLFVLSFSIIIGLLSTIAYAHSGKTDEYGGHYDNSTGEYHYHHGYPAHQHTNGICPYDFDDKTDKNTDKRTIQNLDFKSFGQIYWTIIVTIFIISCLIIIASELMINKGVKSLKDSFFILFMVLVIAAIIIASTVWILGNIVNLLFKNFNPLKILIAFYDCCFFTYSVYSLTNSIKIKKKK